MSDQTLIEMRRASALVDDADGPQEYQTRLIALALIARQFVREAALSASGAGVDPSSLTVTYGTQQFSKPGSPAIYAAVVDFLQTPQIKPPSRELPAALEPVRPVVEELLRRMQIERDAGAGVDPQTTHGPFCATDCACGQGNGPTIKEVSGSLDFPAGVDPSKDLARAFAEKFPQQDLPADAATVFRENYRALVNEEPPAGVDRSKADEYDIPPCLGCGATMLVGYTIERKPGPFCRHCWDALKEHAAGVDRQAPQAEKSL